MKKLSIFAVAFAAFAITACTGSKSDNTTDQKDSIKSFEQEQVEEKIKVELDSLAAELNKMKKVPFLQKDENGIQLTEQEKQVKPTYLLNPSVADNAITLAQKYRALSALSVDKAIAAMYDMPVDEYDKAISKLAADVDDPSFKDIEDMSSIYEAGEKLYNDMNANGRINQFWQMVGGALVEQFYIMSQNSDKFLTAFDDESASNVTYRIVLLSDAVKRLAGYDSEFEPVSKALEALTPLNAISVEQLKTQLEEAKEKIIEARNEFIK